MHHVIESIGALAGLDNLYFDTVSPKPRRVCGFGFWYGPEQQYFRSAQPERI